MPLRPSRRLPSKFNRVFSRSLLPLVKHKYEHQRSFKRERLRRSVRRAQRTARQLQRMLLWWVGAAAAGVLALGIGLLLFSPLLHLREIRVVRLSPRLDIEHVQQVLAPLFGKHLLFLSTSDVGELLHREIADVESIEVRKVYPGSLVVRIALHPLIARLDIVEPDEKHGVGAGTGTAIDFLTDEGIYVQSPVPPDRSEELPLITLVDWGARPVAGTHLVPLDLLELLKSAESALKEQFGHAIEGRTVYLRGQEVHLTANGASLWFDLRSSLEQSLRRYRTFLQSVPREGVTEYVDLRLRDRVIYR